MKKLSVLLLALVLVLSVSVVSYGFGADVFLGQSFHQGNSVTVGGVKISDASWSSHKIGDLGYHVARVRLNSGEFEYIHDGAFLENSVAGVNGVELSRYSALFYNRIGKLNNFEVRFGFGVVGVDVSGEVGGVALNDGMKVTGPAGQLALGYRLPLVSVFSFMVEGKVTKAFINTRNINTDFTTGHVLFGLGVDF